MTLNFERYPILNPEEYRRPSYDELVNRPIQQGLQGFVDLREQRGRDQEAERLRQRQELEDRVRQLQLVSSGIDPMDVQTAYQQPKPLTSLFRGQQSAAGASDYQAQQLPVSYQNTANRYAEAQKLKFLQESEDRALSRRNTESQIAERERRANNVAQKPPAGYQWNPDGTSLVAIPGGPASVKGAKNQSDLDATYNLYETARQGLLSGLGATNTGPIMGRIPAFTTGQQVAEGGVAAMAPVLKQLFRVAGEGVFTDRDQALLLQMIPTRTTNPDAIKAQIENIDNIVKAKLRMGSQASRKITVSNGQETLEIDPEDEAEAAADGYRRF